MQSLGCLDVQQRCQGGYPAALGDTWASTCTLARINDSSFVNYADMSHEGHMGLCPCHDHDPWGTRPTLAHESPRAKRTLGDRPILNDLPWGTDGGHLYRPWRDMSPISMALTLTLDPNP